MIAKPLACRGAPRLRRAAFLVCTSLVLALGAFGLLAGCSGKGAGGGFQMPPAPVEVAEVAAQTVRDEFRALGNLEAAESVEMVSELNAVVVEMPFAEGRAVESGDLIAQLDDREIRAEAQRAEAQREQATANAARARKLAGDGAISQQQLDDALTALKVAEANEAQAKARLDKTRIRAPFAGLVGRRRVSPGAYLKSGDVITEVARVSPMKVGFPAPERYLTDIRRGVAVQVTTPAFPGRTFDGSVSVVDPIVDPNTRTVQIIAHISNPQRVLRPGMSADVSVTLGERTKAVVVPDEAVFAEGNQMLVYVVNPDTVDAKGAMTYKVARTVVELGTRDSARVEIVRGLSLGTKVVRSGHQKLYEGARVMPLPAGPPAEAQGAAGGRPGAASGAAAKSGTKP